MRERIWNALLGITAGMRAGAFAARSCLFVLLLLVSSLALSPESQAKRKWWWSKVGHKHKWSLGIEGGLRYMTHYNQQSVITTPPTTLLGELQATLWYKQQGGIYLLFSRSATTPASQLYGGGIKFPFLAFNGNNGSVVGGITMMLVADLVYYSYPPPAPPSVYTQTGLFFRYGAGINWGIGQSGALLDTTMMVTTANGNFFLAPLIGLGFQF